MANGDLPVLLLTELLYANSAWDNARSHYLGFLLEIHQIRFPKVQSTTYIWPLVCGWLVLLYFKEVSKRFHKVRHKWLMNLVSWLEVMDFGTPCKRTTSLKKRLATQVASKVFLHAVKWDIFEYLSTTINTKSIPRWVWGRPSIKSIDRTSHGACGSSKDMYKSVF